MQKIGIVGGIGSGKSAVGKLLSEKGYSVLDCDREVHELYARSGDLRALLAKNFGPEVLAEGGVNKRFLADLVFEKPEKRLLLEALVYPFLEEAIKEFFAGAKSDKAFLEAALLHKLPRIVAGLDALWVVDAPEAVRLERLASRGLSRPDALRRISAQKESPDFGNVPKIRVQNDADLAALDLKISALLCQQS